MKPMLQVAHGSMYRIKSVISIAGCTVLCSDITGVTDTLWKKDHYSSTM